MGTEEMKCVYDVNISNVDPIEKIISLEQVERKEEQNI